MGVSSEAALSCSACNIRPLCVVRGLTGWDLKRFEGRRGQVRVLRRDKHLFRAGDEFDTVYMVRSGTVKTVETTDDGKERSIGLHFPGEILGLDGIGTQQHRCTAISLESSSVCPIPYRALVSLCAEIERLREQVWRAMSDEIARKQNLLMTIETKDASGRLATFLLYVSGRLQRIGYSATEIRLTMGRHEIGELLDLNLETVSRVLTRFHNAGLIERERRLIKLLKLPQLQALMTGAEDCLKVEGLDCAQSGD